MTPSHGVRVHLWSRPRHWRRLAGHLVSVAPTLFEVMAHCFPFFFPTFVVYCASPDATRSAPRAPSAAGQASRGKTPVGGARIGGAGGGGGASAAAQQELLTLQVRGTPPLLSPVLTVPSIAIGPDARDDVQPRRAGEGARLLLLQGTYLSARLARVLILIPPSLS